MPDATVYMHCILCPIDDRTAVPHEGNIRVGHVVVTPVCTILVFTPTLR